MRRMTGGYGVNFRRVTVLVSAVLTAAVVAAAATADTSANAKDISRLTWGLGASIRGLEYTHSADSGSATVISLGCETLVRYDQLGRLKPALATSFNTPDALTYVYTIRQNVKFWDGTTTEAR